MKKKKSSALVIAPAASSADSAGASSAGSEDAQSSLAPRDAWVASGGGSGAVAVPPSSLHGAAGGAVLPETDVAPACSPQGAASGAEQPEASATNPMPNILGGLCSSSKEGTEAVPPRTSSPPPVTSSPPEPGAGVGQPEALLAEHASAVRASPSPPPARPLAGSSRPSGPSPHDGAEASAQGAHQAACPGPFMSEFVWRAFVFVLFSPSSSVFVFCQVLMLRICCFAGGVMAGLLTPEEQAATASARFGPWQQGPLAPRASEHSLFLAYSSFGLLLLPTSNRPSDLSCYCCYFSLRRLLRHFYLRLGRVLSWSS